MNRPRDILWVGVLLALFVPAGAFAQTAAICEMSDEEILDMMRAANEKLAADGRNIAIEEIECFTIGRGRPPVRIHQQPFRWVPNDPRRLAQGDDITYIVDLSSGGTSSGLTAASTTPAINSAMSTWDNIRGTKKMDIVTRSDPGSDITIFDSPLVSFFGICVDGGIGNPFAADIVHAGWFPPQCFGFGTLAFSVSFIFVSGPPFVPTDINGDQYLDTALNEVYYNDAFGNPDLPAGDPRVGFPWTVGGLNLPNIDVQTVALHESGHSLELGHFGPPPKAVMNPVYDGPRLSPFPIDRAGMAIVWRSWPKP